jgi:hypothetical protein
MKPDDKTERIKPVEDREENPGIERERDDFGILKWPSSEFCFGPPQGNERVL